MVGPRGMAWDGCSTGERLSQKGPMGAREGQTSLQARTPGSNFLTGPVNLWKVQERSERRLRLDEVGSWSEIIKEREGPSGVSPKVNWEGLC